MKKWLIIIGVAIVLLVIIGVMKDAGWLEFKWTTLTMVFTALAAPYQFVKNKLFNKNSSLEDILQQNRESIKADEAHRVEYDNKIAQKEQTIQRLEKQVETLDTRLKDLETKQSNVAQEVKSMSTDEIANEFEQMYGDEKGDE